MTLSSTDKVAAGEWSHVAVSFGPVSGSMTQYEARFYINGEEAGLPAAVPMSALYVGEDSETAEVQLGGFIGRMFEARV